MASDTAVATARRHATRETIDGAARRFLELVNQNPDIKRGVLADRAGSPHGISGAAVIKAAKALSVPVAQLGGTSARPIPEDARKVIATLFGLIVEVFPHKRREELAWWVATGTGLDKRGVTATTVRRWAGEYRVLPVRGEG